MPRSTIHRSSFRVSLASLVQCPVARCFRVTTAFAHAFFDTASTIGDLLHTDSEQLLLTTSAESLRATEGKHAWNELYRTITKLAKRLYAIEHIEHEHIFHRVNTTVFLPHLQKHMCCRRLDNKFYTKRTCLPVHEGCILSTIVLSLLYSANR
jgi:hypothetical protein